MSTDRDVERIVRSWMDEGVTQLPDRVLDLVLDQIPATPQRRASSLARRIFEMNTYARVGLIAAALLGITIVGISLFGRTDVGPPAPTPSLAPSPTPVANPLAGTWVAPDATCGRQITTIEAAGYTAEQMAAAGFDPTCADNAYLGAHAVSDTLQYSLVFNALPGDAVVRGAHILEHGTDIAGSMVYRLIGDDTFEFGGPKGAGFEWCLTVQYAIDGDRLTITNLEPGCATAGDPPLLDQFALTAVLETSTFTRQP